MARLPGLTPITEDTPEPQRTRQTQPMQDTNIRAPALVPQAQNVSTFARSMPAPQDDRAERLAQSLVSLNPGLQRFAQTIAEDGKDKVSSSVQAKILGVGGDPKKVEELMASDPEMQSGLGKAAASRRLGRLVASQVCSALREAQGLRQPSDARSLDLRELRLKFLNP